MFTSVSYTHLDVYKRQIYHDDRFTYIKTNAPEKFSVYEMKDGKPSLVTYDLREGTYIIPKIMDSGYVELGKTVSYTHLTKSSPLLAVRDTLLPLRRCINGLKI